MLLRFAPDAVLDTSPDGLRLIEGAEGFRASWYRCPAGVWTIGYGTTAMALPGVTRKTLPGPVTRAEAAGLMQRSLARNYEPGVEQAIKVAITQGMYDACVSLAYNIGVDRFRRSRLCAFINAGDFAGASRQFRLWVFAAGKVMPGLVARREAERRLFVSTPPAPGPGRAANDHAATVLAAAIPEAERASRDDVEDAITAACSLPFPCREVKPISPQELPGAVLSIPTTLSLGRLAPLLSSMGALDTVPAT